MRRNRRCASREDRIIQLAGGFQMGAQPLGLTSRDPERQFQEECWRRFAFLVRLFV
jgi:hypothetical protein